MHVIVAGCGRVGAGLASSLDAQGHEVVVIDKQASAFHRLEESYGGRRLQGIVFDHNTLADADIAHADAFVAVTSGDNSNVVSARTARDRYGVRQVVARIHDPERAEIFARFGIVTLADARWSIDEIRRELLGEEEHFDAALGAGAGEVVVLTAVVPDEVDGVQVQTLSQSGRWTVAAVTREGRTEVPTSGSLVSGGDRVHVAVARDLADEARAEIAALGAGQGSHRTGGSSGRPSRRRRGR